MLAGNGYTPATGDHHGQYECPPGEQQIYAGPVDTAVHEYSVLVDAASQGIGIQSNDFRGCFTQDEPIEDYGVDTAIGINLPMGTIGTGDMRKSVYDMDDDGIVDAAETAPWDGITGKPATFPPASHTHDPSDIIGLGANTYATDIGDGSATEYTVTHNLNRLDLLIQARRNVPPRTYVTPTVEILTSNTVKLTFDVAPAAGAMRAIITGIGPETTPPVAAFTFAPPSGLAPLSVTFTDASTGIIDAWAWDFGDGNTSTERNPSHTYTQPGQYTPSSNRHRANRDRHIRQRHPSLCPGAGEPHGAARGHGNHHIDNRHHNLQWRRL